MKVIIEELKRENEILKRENEILKELLQIQEKRAKKKLNLKSLKVRKKFTKEID